MNQEGNHIASKYQGTDGLPSHYRKPPPNPQQTNLMLDIGLSELLVILAVALIVLGPKKLPEIARSLGRSLAEVRRASDDLRRSILLEDNHNEKTTPQNPLSTLSSSGREDGTGEEFWEEEITDSEETESAPSSEDSGSPAKTDREPH